MGESVKSPYSISIRAAKVPSRPEPLKFSATTSTTITLVLTPVKQNGGSAVSAYKLYADDGDDTQENFTHVTSYVGNALQHTINGATETRFVTGKTYRFKVTATNAIGESEQSNQLRVALAKIVAAPQKPVIDKNLSTRTSHFITWQEGTPAGDIPILGYKLFMIEKGSGKSSLAYDGSLSRSTKSFNVKGLETGKYYAFYVTARDFNGESQPSEEVVGVVCEKPGHISRPAFVKAQKTSIEVAWTAP